MDWSIRRRPDSANASIAGLMRLNLMLLLFVSFLPFTHLTATRAGLPAERVAVVLLAVSVLYVVEQLWHIRIRIRRPSQPG